MFAWLRKKFLVKILFFKKFEFCEESFVKDCERSQINKFFERIFE